jgi:GT2 family glycosyltransferase
MNISIIIITYNRSKYVQILLSSLKKSRSNFKHQTEIIVVDDSNPDEAQRISSACFCHNARYVKSNSRSVNIKRNIGANLALHPIILFLDSDCEAHPKILEAHLSAYKTGDIGACLGLLEFVGPNNWFWQVITKTPFILAFEFPKHMETAPWGPSANFSVRADVFKSIGGFDETFPPRPGGEDVDLGLRITKAGYKIRCNPDALVSHTKDTWNRFKLMRKRLFTWGKAEYHLMDRHPNVLQAALPRFTLIFIIITFISLLLSLAKKNLFLLTWPILWSVVNFLTYSILYYFRTDKTLKNMIQQMVALILILINELGLLKEILFQRRFDLMHKKMIYTPGQLVGEWYFGGFKIWSILSGMLFLLMTKVFI